MSPRAGLLLAGALLCASDIPGPARAEEASGHPWEALCAHKWVDCDGTAEDAEGNLYLWGRYAKLGSPPELPLKNPAQAKRGGHIDAFLAKFDRDRKLVYASYLGGSRFDAIAQLALGRDGTYALGITYSPDFPVKNAAQPAYGGGSADLFLAKLAPDGSLVYASYLGGEGTDDLSDHLERSVAAEADGSAYVGGRTDSRDFPLRKPWQGGYGGGKGDGFIVRLDSRGKLLYSTYLGGEGDEGVSRLALEGEGYLRVAGYSFPSGSATGIGFEALFDPEGQPVEAPRFASPGTPLPEKAQ